MIFAATLGCSNPKSDNDMDSPVYQVKRLSSELPIDAKWNKSQWKGIESLEVQNYMGDMPSFRPTVKAKMLYDESNLYVIFQVEDRFVRSITTKINGPVWKDSCVEFFFSPNSTLPLQYFNLETNCGGTPLLSFRENPESELNRLPDEEIQRIEIATSLPKVNDPEITDPLTWTIEYRVPLDILTKYSDLSSAGRGGEVESQFL